MKQKILITLIACCTAVMANAATEYKTKSPERLIAALSALYEKYGDKSATTQNSSTNPDTDMLEECYKIMTVKVPKNDPLLLEAVSAFEQDKDCGYQYCHIAPGDKQNFSITISGTETTPRESVSQEIWLINAKNPDNPSLRDNYTLVLDDAQGTRTGKIYLVTSMRPKQEGTPESNPENSTHDQPSVSLKLSYYRDLLRSINDQITTTNNRIARTAEVQKAKDAHLQLLFKEANDIMTKMSELVKEYAE